jgi:hypothetical protein
VDVLGLRTEGREVNWLSSTRETIEEVHKTLPAIATEQECKKALSAAYPFGERAMSPYKTWLHNVNVYLAQRFPGGEASKRLQAKRDRKSGLSPLPESVQRSLFGGGE